MKARTNSWCAIWDWDGVVIDSSAHHRESWRRLAAENALMLPPDSFNRGFGMKNERIIPEILGWSQDPEEIARLTQRKAELYRDVIAERGIEPLPGVAEWLGELRSASVPCAIASSTSFLNIKCILDLLGWGDRFDAIVSAEDVARGKPDPQVFLLAAEKTGTPPERCVVFEDAHVGIEAARAAGMKVVAVATTHAPDALRNADRVVHRLDELTLEEIAEWF